MKPSNTRSFTLFEVLFASTLAVVIIVAFLNATIMSFSYLRRIMELRTATLVLQEQVSVVRELTFSNIQSLGRTFSSSGMSSLDNATGTISRSSYGGSNKITKIAFKLDWTTFDNKPANKTLVTLMTDHGINKK